MSHFEASVTFDNWDIRPCSRRLKIKIFGLDVACVIPYHTKQTFLQNLNSVFLNELIKFVFEASVTNQIAWRGPLVEISKFRGARHVELEEICRKVRFRRVLWLHLNPDDATSC